MPFSGWDAALIALKAVTYGATLGAAGTIFFLNYAHTLLVGATHRSIRHVAESMAGIAVIAGGAQIIVMAGSMGGDASSMLDGTLVRMVWKGGASLGLGLRVAGFALALPATRYLHTPSWTALAGAMMAASSFAWIGHAHSMTPDPLPMLLLGVHLLGIAFWLGALTPLLMVLCSSDPRVAASVAARFSVIAIGVVAVLIAAGMGLLWMLLGRFSELWGSTYGRFMSLKLLLVAGLLCCAAVNKWRLTPRLLTNEPAAVRGLKTSIRLEMLLAGLILTTTAVFTTIDGPPALQ